MGRPSKLSGIVKEKKKGVHLMSVDGNKTNRTHYPRRKQNLYQQMQELPNLIALLLFRVCPRSEQRS